MKRFILILVLLCTIVDTAQAVVYRRIIFPISDRKYFIHEKDDLTATHDILSSTHTDSTTDTVTRGSLIYANTTPAWDELVIGSSGTLLKCDGTDVFWDSLEIEDFNSLNVFSDEDIVTYESSSGGGFEGMTIDELLATMSVGALANNSVGVADMIHEDHGDVTWISGSAALDVNSVAANELLSGDYGDVSIDGAGAITLDPNTVAASELLSGDYGDIVIDGAGVINVQNAETTTVADTDDTTSFVALWESVTGDLGSKSDPNLTYNAGAGTLGSDAIVIDGTKAIGLDMSGGTFATAIQKWPAGTISTAGTTVFQPDANSTTSYQWKDAGGNVVLNLDSTNKYLLVYSDVQIMKVDSSGLNVTGGIRTIKDQDWLGLAAGESAAKYGAVVWRNVLEKLEIYTEGYDYPVHINNSLFVDTDSNNSNVGIGTTTPDTKHQVVGDLKVGDDNTNYTSIGTTGNVSFTGSAELIIPSSTTLPGTTNVGSLYLDANAGANGTVYMYANGAWRAMIVLP